MPETESNRRHGDFQSPALPTELSGRRRALNPFWTGVSTLHPSFWHVLHRVNQVAR